MKIVFADGLESDTLDFQNGEYSRQFERKDQPFDVTDEEWQTLQRTKFFEPIKDAAPEQPENQSNGEPSKDEPPKEEPPKEEPPSVKSKRTSRAAQNNQQSE